MDGMIILVVVALVLFGSTQIPKLARSLGSAKTEFKQGLAEGESAQPVEVIVPVAPAALTPTAVHAPAGGTPVVRVTSDTNTQ